MLSDLLAHRRVRTVYQPIVDRASRQVIGYEALSRGPEGHPLERPDLLFAAARREGQLAELDWLCRAQALEGALAAGLRSPAALFVNVESDVFDAHPPPAYADALSRSGGLLTLLYEVTERGLSSRPAELLAEVERARALGFGIAVDDVGTDWRSLALLPFIRPDVVKLDMKLIQDPLTDAGLEIASAVRAYADETGAQILAEGIETAAHEARAELLGARLAQGWKYGRPAPLPAAAAPRVPAYDYLVVDTRTIDPSTPATIALATRDGAVASKDALVRLSIAIERRAMEAAEPSVVLGTFQQVEHFQSRRTRERFERLAAGEAFVGAFGVGMPPAPAPGVRGAALAVNDQLAGEWHVIVVGPHHAEALIARDLGDGGPDAQRRFELVHTRDRELVVRAARSLMLSILPNASRDLAAEHARAA